MTCSSAHAQSAVSTYLAQRTPSGRRAAESWIGQGLGPQPLNGMSHGAAGFAYALAELAAVTGREEFANGSGGVHRVRKFHLR